VFVAVVMVVAIALRVFDFFPLLKLDSSSY
jgi:hypothetical protein